MYIIGTTVTSNATCSLAKIAVSAKVQTLTAVKS